MGNRNSGPGKCSFKHHSIVLLKTFTNCDACRIYMYLPSAPWAESKLSSQEWEGTICIIDFLCLNQLGFFQKSRVFFSLGLLFLGRCQYLYMIFCLSSWCNSLVVADLFHNVGIPRQFCKQSQMVPCLNLQKVFRHESLFEIPMSKRILIALYQGYLNLLFNPDFCFNCDSIDH